MTKTEQALLKYAYEHMTDDAGGDPLYHQFVCASIEKALEAPLNAETKKAVKALQKTRPSEDEIEAALEPEEAQPTIPINPRTGKPDKRMLKAKKGKEFSPSEEKKRLLQQITPNDSKRIDAENAKNTPDILKKIAETVQIVENSIKQTGFNGDGQITVLLANHRYVGPEVVEYFKKKGLNFMPKRSMRNIASGRDNAERNAGTANGGWEVLVSH